MKRNVDRNEYLGICETGAKLEKRAEKYINLLD